MIQDKDKMAPLRVTWRLRRPVWHMAHGLHLDSLLAWAAVQRITPDPFTYEEDICATLASLPLDKARGPGGAWTWKASQVQFDWTGPPVAKPLVRRTDPLSFIVDRDRGLFESGLSVLNTGSGQWRGYLEACWAQWAPTAQAWCVGNAREILSLLREVPSLGPCARLMGGEVVHVTVSPDPLALDLWRRRTLPAGSPYATANHVPAVATILPPYFRRSQAQHALVYSSPLDPGPKPGAPAPSPRPQKAPRKTAAESRGQTERVQARRRPGRAARR